MIANQPITVLSFIAVATLFNLGIGWLIKEEKLPLKRAIAYSQAQRQFIKFWIVVAILLSTILPSIILVNFWNEPIARQFLSLYLLALGMEILNETVFSRLLCKSIVVVVGTIYTTFICLLWWEGLHLTAYPQPWLSLLWLVMLYWIGNATVLITVAWPSIVGEESTERSANS